MSVAALYVDPAGVYANLPGVEVWGEERDARLYDGPHPVVAHPPCNKWGSLAYINQRLIPGYRIGDDGGCFAAALAAVRRFGGVLEHPAFSIAWKHFGLPRPLPIGCGWTGTLLDPGVVCSVSQAAYGHRAFKETWLYFYGKYAMPPDLDWSKPEVSARISSFTHGKPRSESERVRPKEASATPQAFRDVLLEMARTAHAAALDTSTRSD